MSEAKQTQMMCHPTSYQKLGIKIDNLFFFSRSLSTSLHSIKITEEETAMEITGEDYSVKYDAETTTIYWQGIMRLESTGYKAITQFLEEVMALQPSQIIFDLRKLKSFNSSGVTMLSRFLLNLGRKNAIPLIIRAIKDITWQKSSLKHFQKLVPKLQIEWEE